MSIVSIFTHNKDLIKEKKISDNLHRIIYQDCLDATKTGLFARYEPEYRDSYIKILDNIYSRATKAHLYWKYPDYESGLPYEVVKLKLSIWSLLLHNFGYMIDGEPCVTVYHKTTLVDLGWMVEPPEDVINYTHKPPIYFITKGKIPYL